VSTHTDDGHPAPARRPSAGQDRPALFAGILMIVAGLWHVFIGIAALARDQVYLTAPQYSFQLDLTGWGWTHLLIGALLCGAAVGVLQGRTWGRVVGTVLAILSMFANFLFLPHYPIWSILIMLLDVVIAGALITDDRER
jgi:hypothetical protein